MLNKNGGEEKEKRWKLKEDLENYENSLGEKTSVKKVTAETDKQAC